MSVVWVISMILGAGLLLMIYGSLILPKQQRRRFIKKKLLEFGKPPADPVGLEAAKPYWRSYSDSLSEAEMAACVDDITWHDLNMDEIFNRINACQTSVGDAQLYCALRNPKAAKGSIHHRERLAQLLESRQDLRLEIQILLDAQGRKGGNSIDVSYLRTRMLLVKNQWRNRILAFLPVLGLLAFPWNPMLSGVWLAITFALNCIFTALFKEQQEEKYFAIRYLVRLIATANKLAQLLESHDPDFAKQLKKAAAPFRILSSSLAVLRTDEFFVNMLGFASPLAMFMLPALSFGKIFRNIHSLHESVGELYEAIGCLDTAIALLSFEKSIKSCCKPVFTTSTKIVFEGLCHPLVHQAVPNSGAFENDVLVTGSNASGKSTFIKAVAVNCILAQSINRCTAGSFILRKGRVATSMAVSDNIVSGDSYFIAEIKYMKRLISLAEEGFGYFFIDEILRGTNTVERVAAASAVIAYLHERDCLCFSATHDIELTTILAEKCENIHFRETVDDGGVHFDYQMQQGPSTSRNAIVLLSALGFPEEIVQKSAEKAEYFTETGQWMHGNDCQ